MALIVDRLTSNFRAISAQDKSDSSPRINRTSSAVSFALCEASPCGGYQYRMRPFLALAARRRRIASALHDLHWLCG